MQVTCFSQRNPRWANEILGTGDLTIGQAGCLVSAMASVLCDFGVPTDPHRLNQWLISHGGYARENLFVWRSVEGLGCDLVQLVNCQREPAPIDALTEALNGGCSVVAEVDYTPGGVMQRHWVRLMSLQTQGGWIMDPWQMPGGEMVSIHDYLLPSWDTARGIFAAAVYTHNGGMRFEVTEHGDGHQAALAVRPE